MATSSKTPRKPVVQNCFCCETRERHYNVKFYQEGIIVNKIACLTGEDRFNVERHTSNINAGICKVCNEKLDKAFTFVTNLKKKVVAGESSGRNKRMAVSPITPENRSLKRVSAVRRSLVFEEEKQMKNSSFNEHDYSLSICNEHAMSEHEYSRPLKAEKETTIIIPSALEHMKLAFKEESEPVNCTVQEVVDQIASNETIMKAVQSKILQDVDRHCAELVSRNAAVASALSRYRDLDSLVENGRSFFEEIIQEMAQRLPFLLKLFSTIVTAGTELADKKVANVVAAYAILMNGRHSQLSAWHRLTTVVAISGHLDDIALTRMNNMGLTLSTSTKLRILDEAGDRMDNSIALRLKTNPIVKITGDNLDMYVRTSHKSLDKANRDIHLFASNIIFSRIVSPGMYSMLKPECDLQELTPDMFFPCKQERTSLRRSYCVLLGRILMEFPAFSWLKPVVPSHMYHQYQSQMSQKSEVYLLPIQMKNEAKHEDCVDILDGYEDILTQIYNKAFGTDDLLQRLKVVVGGDQLTRVRLEEAKQLRALATCPKKRFDDLDPFIVELWHVKQDYLEKCYKELYKSETLRQPGTLFHYKSKLQRSDVTGKVKGAFKSHYEFLCIVGKNMIQEQMIEYFGMEDRESEPTRNVPKIKKALTNRQQVMFETLESFMDFYGYLDNTHESTHEIRTVSYDDTVFNYSNNLCQWYLNLIHMEDVVKEGDVTRLIPTLKYTLQFFFSHSRLSKYFVECLDFILKVEYLASPQQRMRILEGAFVNLRGGLGQNIECDLVQEMAVRNQKDLIKSLGANKTDKAITRCTKAANTVSDICSNIDCSVKVKKQSTRHHIPKAVKDEEVLKKSLRELRPFSMKLGRECKGMHKITSSPLLKIKTEDLKDRVKQVVSRLFYGQTHTHEEVSDDEYYGDDD